MTPQKVFVQLCKESGLPEPKPEHRFHPSRKWRCDWFFEANGKSVALEVEGGIWQFGRHNRPKGFSGDMEKYNALSMHGIFLLRVTPGNLLKMATIEMVRTVLGLEK